MTESEQVEQWVAGTPIHRGELHAPDSECCPDFSCCYPELLQPLEVRQAYLVGTSTTRGQLLGAFLAALLEHVGAGDVHIAGRIVE